MLRMHVPLTVLWLGGEQQDHKETQQREQGKHNGTWCDWAGNGIGVEGARALGDALKTNTTLTQLDLECERQTQRTRQAQGQEE